MTLDLEHAREVLRAVVCGELAASSPEFRAAAAAFPQLVDELAQLRAIQGALDGSTGDAPLAAAAAIGATTPADRRRVHKALASRAPRRRTWMLLLAAVLVVGLLVVEWTRSRALPTGMLGSAGSVVVERTERGVVVSGLGDLSPGSRYRLELRAGSIVLRGEFDTAPILLPLAWQQAIDGSGSADLVVEIPGVDAVRVPLR